MKLSVITPVYNRADCIVRCLDSVTSQLGCGAEIEHVVVDDGSTDKTADIIREYAGAHPHLKTVFFEKNRGTNAARNAAVRTASGDYCVMLDSDDYFTQDACRAISTAIHAYPDAGCFMFTIDYRADMFDKMYGRGSVVKYTYKEALDGKIVGDYTHVFRRDIFIRYPFDEDLRIYESLIIRQIYREVKEMIFVNSTVVVVDTGRVDRVTWDTLRINENIISRKLQAAVKEYELFGDDLLTYGGPRKVEPLVFQIADNALLLCKYELAVKFIPKISDRRKKAVLRLIATAKLGKIYQKALELYLKCKYRGLTANRN